MKYFTIDELSHSETAVRRGVDNTPPPQVVKSLIALVENILDPLRELCDYPIVVSSGYRCPNLNKIIGGSPTSQHPLGEAADITCPALGTKRLFDIARTSNLPFDQLIFEGTWVHISFGQRQRREILVATFVDGKATYRKFE